MNKHCKNKIQRNRDKLCVLDKNVNIQQLNRKKHIKILARSGIEPGTSRTPVRCVTTGSPRQLNVSIVVKLFYCFNTMGLIHFSFNCNLHG